MSAQRTTFTANCNCRGSGGSYPTWFPLSPRENPRCLSACLGWTLAFLNHSRVLLAEQRGWCGIVLKARKLLPDVIVNDNSMPILTGVDAAHKLKESSSNAIFIFLTVHSEKVFIKAVWKQKRWDMCRSLQFFRLSEVLRR